MPLTRVVDKTKQKQNRIYYIRNAVENANPFSGIFVCMNGDMCCYYDTMHKTQNGVYTGYFSQIPINNIHVWDTGIDFLTNTPFEIMFYSKPTLLIKRFVLFNGTSNSFVVETSTNSVVTIIFNNDTIKSVVPLTSTIYAIRSSGNASAFDAEAATMFVDYFGGGRRKKITEYGV